MIVAMADDGGPDLRGIQWLITFCLVIVAVVLFGVVIGALLRGSGVR